MSTQQASKLRRAFALPRFFISAVLILAGAVMALYAASPGEESLPADPGEESPPADTSQKSRSDFTNDIYIVQLRGAPAVMYKGELPGLSATAVSLGQKMDPETPNVIAYASHLRAQHDTMLSQMGGEKVYSYTYALNGFAAKMTSEQAAAMRAQDDVISVEKDEASKMDTSTTPRFLGLSAPGGLWDQLGGGSNQSNGPGENMVVGIVDTGVWPEHPSFSGSDEQGNAVYAPLVGFTGTCDTTSPDNSWNATYCNNKIVAARKYNAGHGGDAGITAKYPWEFLSPRDYSGHGSHTASTAGGNNGVLPDNHLAFLGRVSGMAPRARIAVYKVCWETRDPLVGGCFTSDSVAAIDQATADGVDGINFSISGTTTNFNAPVEVAFRNAAQAGVFVSTSAGNSGPGASTVAHPSPWAITVANGSHDRITVATLTLGDGQTFTGVSSAPNGVGPAPLINAQDAGAASAPSANSVNLCFSATWNNGPASLDPAIVSGKIVVCERGTNDRVDKSRAVAEAGGIGMVLVNTSANTLNGDFHSVPSVHLDHIQRTPVQTYAATSGATASISQAVVTTQPAPFTAGSSSRGPSLAAGGDILKPDVMAPGSDVLAAVAPPNNGNQLFALYSGTSMSAPHVLGVGILLKQQHTSWSPMMIKSALMTTGTNILDTGISEATRITRQGAGQIQPNNATNPGLVFDSNINDWTAFLCGATTSVPQATCNGLVAAGFSTNPSDLNMASIAIGDLVGSETVKRTVTNVSSSGVTYTASVTPPPGVNVVVNPTSLTLSPGQTGSFNVTFTRTNAASGTYVGGQLTWTGGGHTVRIPLVARPVIIAVASTATSSGSPMSLPVRFGYDGPFNATPRGLIPATLQQGTVSDDPNDSFIPGGPGTTSFDVVVPAGTTYARFALFDTHTDGNDDLDLVVYRVSTNTLVASTGGATSNEEANLVNPPADTYR
ncbi:MAG: S8 family serine peptidase, partial [Verrucomicrobiota bacterium]|nr:S8 family serine peptidase [Verrucomicrobiota bacterium]